MSCPLSFKCQAQFAVDFDTSKSESDRVGCVAIANKFGLVILSSDNYNENDDEDEDEDEEKPGGKLLALSHQHFENRFDEQESINEFSVLYPEDGIEREASIKGLHSFPASIRLLKLSSDQSLLAVVTEDGSLTVLQIANTTNTDKVDFVEINKFVLDMEETDDTDITMEW